MVSFIFHFELAVDTNWNLSKQPGIFQASQDLSLHLQLILQMIHPLSSKMVWVQIVIVLSHLKLLRCSAEYKYASVFFTTDWTKTLTLNPLSSWNTGCSIVVKNNPVISMLFSFFPCLCSWCPHWVPSPSQSQFVQGQSIWIACYNAKERFNRCPNYSQNCITARLNNTEPTLSARW